MKKLATMREALADPALLGDVLLGDSWFGWRVLLIAVVGEALISDAEHAEFKKLTGRDQAAMSIVEVLLVIAGRRSGKTKAMAVLVVFLACLCDWTENLSLGERGLALFFAPSEWQAAIAFRYAAAIIDHVPLLSALVEARTVDTLTLARGIDLQVHAASKRLSRGGTAICIILDECAFFHTGDDAANSDTELMTALRPSLATTGGPMLLTSSPAQMEGIVYRIHKRHYGPAGDPLTLVVQSDTLTLNPSLSARVVERAYEDDATAAAAEFGGEFRTPVTAYLARALVEKVVSSGVTERPALPGVQYLAFVDVAGGNGTDSYTLAIGHNQRREGRDVAVLDAIFETRPPFDPDIVTATYAEALRRYRVQFVVGDAYGGSWPISTFARNGIGYQHAALNKSEIYLHSLPLFTAARVDLLDHQRLVDQLAGLRRKLGQGGRETVDHARGAHDDLANCVCGVLWRLSPAQPAVSIVSPILFSGGQAGFRTIGGGVATAAAGAPPASANPAAAWTAAGGYRDIGGAERFDNSGSF